MVNFQHQRGDSSSISSSWLHYSFIDSKNRFWVGSIAGLNLFHRETGTFSWYQHDPDNPNSLSDNRIRSILEDSRGRLWVASISAVDLFEPDSNRFTKVEIENLAGSRHSPNLIEGRDGIIWVCHTNGLTRIDPETMQGTNIAPIPPDLPQNVFGAWMSPDSTLWISSKVGVWEQIPGTEDFRQVDLGPDLKYRSFNCFLADSNGILWMGTLNDGLVKYDYQNRKVLKQYTYSPADPEGITNESIYSLMKDRQGNIWIGTFNGVNRINPASEKFQLYQNAQGLDNFSNYIIRIYQEPNGRVWTTTMNGLFYAEHLGEPGTVATHPNLPKDQYISINGFSADPDGKVWFFARDLGLYYWDPIQRKLFFQEPPDTFKGGLHWQITQSPDNPDILWLSDSHGLCRYNKITRDTFWVHPMDFDPRIKSDFSTFFDFDQFDQVWLVINKGILCYNLKTGKGKVFLYDPENPNCVPPEALKGVAVTRDAVYAASSIGLLEIQVETGACQMYGQKDGLVQEGLAAIIAGSDGKIWVSSNSYLSAFDPLTKTFKSYHTIHSIKEFNTYSTSHGQNNRLLFGGTNGYFGFLPDEIRDDLLPPIPVLTGFKVLNENYPLGKLPEYVHEINLSYEDKVITFEYAGLQYARSEANSYKYILEGFDAGWQEVGSKRDVTYTNLRPGNYTFRLAAANPDGVWSPEPLSVKLHISPPYWQTSWFYGLIFLLVASIFYAIFRSRQRARRLTQEMKVAEQSARYKSLFLANMSHEIRTPMNAILGMSKLLSGTPLDNRQQEYASIIQRSSEDLLVIINDILDHSKIESGKYSFVHKPFELSILLKQLQKIFEPQADEKNISLAVHIDPEIPSYIVGDQVRLNQILINLLANALKFTERGKVDLFVRKQAETPYKMRLLFEVRDTGIGIPPDKIEQIFESFEQIEGDEFFQGTGLGLAISSKLVEQQDGNMWVESSHGTGSSFFFELTFGRNSEKISPPEHIRLHPETWPPLHILVVEDTPFNQTLAVELLRNKIPKVQIAVAENGKVALEKLKDQLFDLILMDVKMPVMDGYETTRIIRQADSPALNSIPIIALTANVTTAHMQKCRDVGMNGIITKPIESQELLLKIQQLLQLEVYD